MNRTTAPFLALAALHPAVQAGETADATIVVTASRTEQRADQTGASLAVIEGGEIARRQYPVAIDLVRTLPGVSFARNGGPGGVTTVSIRGAESDQTVVLIDGIKLNDPASPGGGFDFAHLLTGDIARIELVRGAQSVAWGSQAIGGVINLISRAPGDSPELSARAEAGSIDSIAGSASVSGKFGPVSGRVGGSYYRTDGISAFNKTRGGTERDGYRNWLANAAFNLAVSDAVSIDLRGWTTRSRADQDGFPPPNFTFSDTGEFTRTRQAIGYAGLNAALFGGALRNRIGFSLTGIDRTSIDPSIAPGFVTFDTRGRNRRIEYQGVWSLARGAELVFGAEQERSRYAAASFGGPVERAAARLTSFYGIANWQPVEPLSLQIGARHDKHNSFGGNTSLSASLSYRIAASGTRIRASYGEGFKAPSLFQLYSDFGNTLLRPERAESWEAGLVQPLLGGKLVVEAGWFRRKVRDQIAFVSCFGNPSPICANRPFGTYDNVARSRATGVELVLAVKPTEKLSFSGSYSLISTHDLASGLRLARRPRHQAHLSGDWTSPIGLALGATLSMVGDRFDDAANSVRVDGHVLADLRASLPIGDELELTARIENLFDARYETVFLYGTPGRAAYAGLKVKL